MNHNMQYGRIVLPRMVLTLAFVILVAVAFAQDLSSDFRDPRVFPPASLPFGKGYGEWSAEWWQWVFSIPTSENPGFDQTGEKCTVGQRGPVWFLVGVFNISGIATRNCSIPDGLALFFPILNVEWDNIGITPPLTLRELRNLAKSVADAMTDLLVEVDGVPIRDVQLLRVVSPVFSVTLPQQNAYQALGNSAAVPGVYFPWVGDGFYVMLKPLPIGEHTLRIHGKIPSFDITLDVTYHLTVVPLTHP